MESRRAVRVPMEKLRDRGDIGVLVRLIAEGMLSMLDSIVDGICRLSCEPDGLVVKLLVSPDRKLRMLSPDWLGTRE